MISIAITNHNRSDMTIEAFAKVIDNPFVTEVVIVDDCSEENIYNDLVSKVKSLDNDKVFLYRNDKNLGAFFNKYEAIRRCRNEWVIIFDSDNIIDNDYINIAATLEKRPDTIYCPAVVQILREQRGKWNFTAFSDIDLNTAKLFVYDRNFKILMNTGNYLVNRRRYVNTIVARHLNKGFCKDDSFYFNYLWLKDGNRLSVTTGMTYMHRIHDGSYWLDNADLFLAIQNKLIEKIKAL